MVYKGGTNTLHCFTVDYTSQSRVLVVTGRQRIAVVKSRATNLGC